MVQRKVIAIVPDSTIELATIAPAMIDASPRKWRAVDRLQQSLVLADQLLHARDVTGSASGFKFAIDLG